MIKKLLDNILFKNIFLLSALAFLEGFQMLIIFSLIFSFVPITSTFIPDLHPEREALYYQVFILITFILGIVLGLWQRKKICVEDLSPQLAVFAIVLTGIMGAELFAIFKIFVFNDPKWARILLYFMICMNILTQLFWPEVKRILGVLKDWINQTKIKRHIPMATQIVFLGFLMVMFVPDLNSVLARIFFYDKFYHLDSFIMATGWAYQNGLVLNQDVISQYSLIIPIVFNYLSRCTGGFDYPHVVMFLIILTFVYYFLLYAFLRRITNSICLSMIGIAVALKLQMFHWGVTPLVWIYPSATVLRFWPDIFFMYVMWRYATGGNVRWLWWAAIFTGLTLAWMLDVGVYMFATFMVAVLSAIIVSKKNIWMQVTGLLALPIGVAICILLMSYGGYIFTTLFWTNTFEFINLFVQGWGALPVTEGLKEGQYFAFVVGLAIPLLYMSTLMYLAGDFIVRRQFGAHVFIALVCIYGLGLYHYFIHRSGVTSYYVVGIPLVIVIVFWLQKAGKLCLPIWEQRLKGMILFWVLVALATSHLSAYYPNTLNGNSNKWAMEKKAFHEQFDFSKDAQLIARLTKVNEPIALISSFEVRILMQANRKPLFYYFPMMESQFMGSNDVRGTYLHTFQRLQKTLNQLSVAKPEYLFIESRLWEGPVANTYVNDNDAFKQLMIYVRNHYRFHINGKNLVALKRNK